MFKTLYPDFIKLWIHYQENGVSVSGLTNLYVDIKYVDGTNILSGQMLTEEGSSSVYSYIWDARSVQLGRMVNVTFRQNTIVLEVEEYVFDITEDQDGIII